MQAQARTFGFRGQALAAPVASARWTSSRGNAVPLCPGQGVLWRQSASLPSSPAHKSVGGSAVLVVLLTKSGTTVSPRTVPEAAAHRFSCAIFLQPACEKERLKPKAELYDALARMRRIALVLPGEFVFEDGATSRVLFRRLRNFGFRNAMCRLVEQCRLHSNLALVSRMDVIL